MASSIARNIISHLNQSNSILILYKIEKTFNKHLFIKKSQLSNKENMNQSAVSSSCKHCRQLIKSDDYVIRLKWPSSSLYHINCFVCNDCNKKIMPGELYGTVQSTQLVYCNQHYMNQMFTTNTSSKQLETNLVDTGDLKFL